MKHPGRPHSPGHPPKHSDGRELELDFEIDNAIIEAKGGAGRGAEAPIQRPARSQGNPTQQARCRIFGIRPRQTYVISDRVSHAIQLPARARRPAAGAQAPPGGSGRRPSTGGSACAPASSPRTSRPPWSARSHGTRRTLRRRRSSRARPGAGGIVRSTTALGGEGGPRANRARTDDKPRANRERSCRARQKAARSPCGRPRFRVAWASSRTSLALDTMLSRFPPHRGRRRLARTTG